MRLVNQAYVAAVGAESADQVVADQVELAETVNGRTAAEVAQQAADRRQPIERILSATIERARRTIRVTDLPLMGEGIAGYAVDIEEMEEQAREFRAFREAQRSMLDQLSIGVAQFDAGHRMTFANQPFHRVFSLPGVVNERTSFGQMLLIARENGRIPEVRDFPAWRNELTEWFQRDEPHEEAWPLSDSTHLRIVAQPLPDGGLVMIAEDRTEQLALSATRDTLLRTRTATFDNLFEALAVFAPDGHLELWNRGFPGAWGIDPEVLDGHPQAEDLLQAICAIFGPRFGFAAQPGDPCRHARSQEEQWPHRFRRWPDARLHWRATARWQWDADRARRHRVAAGRGRAAFQPRARGGRCADDPFPRQYELRVPHSADLDRRVR